MFKVVVTGNVRSEGLKIIEEFADLVILNEPIKEDLLIEHITDADAILHKMGKLNQNVLTHQKKLQIIARHGVGLDELDLEFIRSLQIPVTITPGANTNAVAEFAISLMLALLRNIPKADHMVKKEHSWARESFMGFEIQSLCVGIVGLGRIGKRVAEMLNAMKIKILAHDPFILSDMQGVENVTFEKLIAQSDIITLHCPLTETTRYMINANNIDSIKKGAFLINTARGKLVDHVALLSALKAAKLRGAAIDVYENEPPDFSSELLQMSNVIATPHIAAMSYDSQIGMAIGAASEIKRVLKLHELPVHNIFSKTQ